MVITKKTFESFFSKVFFLQEIASLRSQRQDTPLKPKHALLASLPQSGQSFGIFTQTAFAFLGSHLRWAAKTPPLPLHSAREYLPCPKLAYNACKISLGVSINVVAPFSIKNALSLKPQVTEIQSTPAFFAV